jgi:biotin operon repressor
VSSLHNPPTGATNGHVNTQDSEAEWSAEATERANQALAEQGAPYAVLPVRIITDPDLKPAPKVLLMLMSTLVVRDTVYHSQADIAVRAGVSPQTISQHIKELSDRGYVRRTTNPDGLTLTWLSWLADR